MYKFQQLLKSISFYSLVLSGFVLSAQNKKFTINECVTKARSFSPKGLQGLQFIGSTKNVCYIKANKLIRLDANGKTSPIDSLESLNAKVAGNQLAPITEFPIITWENDFAYSFQVDGKKVIINASNYKIPTSVSPLNLGATDIKRADVTLFGKSDDGKKEVYLKENNLFVLVDGKEAKLTNDGSSDIVYAQGVHRQEFGIDGGFFWSPKQTGFAFYRMDQSMVTDYPIINWSERPAKSETIKYPFAGDKSHQVTLGVYNFDTQKTVYLKTGEPKEQYLTNIAWSLDETKIYIAVVNREQNHMWMNEYNTSTGDFIKTVFEEIEEKYIEPLHPMLFVPSKPNQFVWQSRRDGFNHLYLYETSGKLIKQLTKGNWEVLDVNGFDDKCENLYFHANEQSPINKDFYKVNIAKAQVVRLTKGSGIHMCKLNSSETSFLDYYSNLTTPLVINLVDIKSLKSTIVHTAENPVKDFAMGAVSLFTIKNNQGIDLYCRMIKPRDFDSTKKYPVLVYLYGGPHDHQIENTWLGKGNLWYHYMAQQGFIVFTLDNRGSENRGKAFEQAIHRQLGTAEMEDQMCGVKYLKNLSYVDANRMGVHGWSFGGFMTTSLMTRNAGAFKVGVAGGPVIDWTYYEIMYGERYMDMPKENEAGYKNNNLLNHLDKLKDDLLIIHGAQDDIVVWQHTMMLLKKATEKSILLDYYVYPGHAHNVVGPDRAHLMQKISDYFIDRLMK